MKPPRIFLLALVLSCSGCFDFVEPDLPQRGAPAFLQAFVHINESAHLRISAVLAPGLTQEGDARLIGNDTVIASGLFITPDSVRRTGTRIYNHEGPLGGPDPFAQPITLVPPRIEGALAAPPVVRWRAVRPARMDTIRAVRGEDVVLIIQRSPEPSAPEPLLQQWIVDLVSEDGNFRFGASGEPPDTIRVPSFWVPPAASGRVAAFLTIALSGAYRPPPSDYLVHFSAEQRLRWNLRISPAR